jgi:hypothetical protein
VIRASKDADKNAARAFDVPAAFSFGSRIDVELWKNPNGLRAFERQRAKKFFEVVIGTARRSERADRRCRCTDNFCQRANFYARFESFFCVVSTPREAACAIPNRVRRRRFCRSKITLARSPETIASAHRADLRDAPRAPFH